MRLKHGQVLLVYIRHGEKKFLLVVFVKRCQKSLVIKFSCRSERYLALAVYNIFLQIKGNRFCRAEITHRIGNLDSHLFTETEEIVDRGTRCKDDACEFGKIHLGLAEFLGCQPFCLYKGTEHHLYIIFLSDIIIRRLISGRFRLRNKYLLNFHVFPNF